MLIQIYSLLINYLTRILFMYNCRHLPLSFSIVKFDKRNQLHSHQSCISNAYCLDLHKTAKSLHSLK